MHNEQKNPAENKSLPADLKENAQQATQKTGTEWIGWVERDTKGHPIPTF